MAGNLALFEAVYTFSHKSFRRTLELLKTLDPRIDTSLHLCNAGDLSPVSMVLMHARGDNDPRYVHCEHKRHPLTLLGAMSGYLSGLFNCGQLKAYLLSTRCLPWRSTIT